MGVKLVYPGIYEFKMIYENDDSEMYSRLARFSGMALDTRITKRLSTFDVVPGREKGFEATLSFIRGEIIPPLLLFCGEVGRSKTHLAMAIGWCFVAQLKTVVYYQVADLLDNLRAGYKTQDLIPEENPQSYDAIMNKVKNWGLLILDDLGVEKETDWVVEKLDTIVDYRYTKELPTVITTNTLDISPRILDRCKEGKIVMLEGQSYREIIQKRKAKG